MGRVYNSNLGGTSGRTARVVIAKVNGIDVSRGIPERRNYIPSEKQLLQQKKFAYCSNFISGYRVYAGQFFGNPEGLRTRYNQAMANVMNCVNQPTPDVFEVDVENIMFSKGDLLELDAESIASTTALEIDVKWTDNSEGDAERANDLFQFLYFWDGDGRARWKNTLVTRATGRATVTVMNRFQGRDVHVWGAFRAGDSSIASDSVYLGRVTVT